jgi:hypothetical protein
VRRKKKVAQRESSVFFFTKYVFLHWFEVKFGEVSKNGEKSSARENCVHCHRTSADEADYERYTSTWFVPSIALALRKRSKQVIGKHSFKFWPEHQLSWICSSLFSSVLRTSYFVKLDLYLPRPLQFIIYQISYPVRYTVWNTNSVLKYVFVPTLQRLWVLMEHWRLFCVTAISLGVLVCLFVFGATFPSGPGPPHSRGF